MRLKTKREKAETEIGDSQENLSVIDKFLKLECMGTQFDTDYISFSELRFEYALFCKNLGIAESKRE